MSEAMPPAAVAQPRRIGLIGVPMEDGARRPGCIMGADALRTAGIEAELAALGHAVEDRGTLRPDLPPPSSKNGAGGLHNPGRVALWTGTIAEAALAACGRCVPVFLGGDHALSLGSVTGHAAQARAAGRRLFVLWLDAHADFHTPETTESGNLHGTPLAYACGMPGFEIVPGPATGTVDPGDVCALGLRSVDGPERALLAARGVEVHDMRAIDEHGIARCLRGFLDRVEAADGLLHVSLDVDFLDPGIAPAVGTTVPGGATFREAHLAMEMLHDTGRVAALDLVELNPFLDDRGRTARLMVDLTASLFGRRIMDRPTGSF